MSENEEELQEEGGEKEPEEPVVSLTAEMISSNPSCLSIVSRSPSDEGYSQSNLVITEKELDELGDTLFDQPNLRYLNISKNKIKDIDLGLVKMKYLQRLDGQTNKIKSLDKFLTKEFNQLQIINLSENDVISLPRMTLPSLKKLDLSSNKIETCSEFIGSETLEELNLSRNQLTTLDGLNNCPSLRTLLLDENKVVVAPGGALQATPKLTSLQLSGNPLEKLVLEGSREFPNMTEVNLSSTALNDQAKLQEALKTLTNTSFGCVRSISLAGSETEGIAKMEIMLLLPRVTTVNGEPVDEEARQEAEAERQRRVEAEAERKAAEEEEKARKATEENQENKEE